MNTKSTFKDSTYLAKQLWNSMTISSRLLALPMLIVLLAGGILTGIIVFSMSLILSAYGSVG